MSDPIYPGATWIPGTNAGYKSGRTSMVDTVCHYTVGVSSTGIGLQGYFNFLVARDGIIQQFAEVDALTWHVGENNAYGPGIEIEYLPGTDPDVFTDAARESCAALVKWLAAEWSIPLQYHDGDHDTQPGSYAGFLSHKSIIQTEQHQDYWPQPDWDAMTASLPSPPPISLPEGFNMLLNVTVTDLHATFFVDLYNRTAVSTPSTAGTPNPLPSAVMDDNTWRRWTKAMKLTVTT